ncbi:MAG TPA: hypothetical protein VF690_19245 [Hymenobacter sp.]|jgi:hypothetical protein
MPDYPSSTPLHAWFTLKGDFVGVSGIPVQLVPGQQLDANAWYTADGRRAAVAGPFDNAHMNRQGYLRGAQIIAAEKLQRAANKTGQAGAGAAIPLAASPAPPSGLKPLDWVNITVGGSGAAGQLAQWELVKTAQDGVERWKSPKTGRWYPVANQPNGATGPRGPVLNAAGRFKVAGWVFLGLGLGLSAYQGLDAYNSTAKTVEEINSRQAKMNKAGLDFAMGLVGLLGPIGFVISTVYFVVDTAVSLSTNGGSNILDLPDLLFGTYQPPGRLAGRTPADLWLVVPADNTRVALPRRTALRRPSDMLRQPLAASHNAVFRPATH